MKEKISTIQIGSILWSLMLSACIGIVPYIVFYMLKQDGWIALIFSFLIGFLILSLYLYIWNKYPDKNIFEKINYIFGNKIGNIINRLYISSNLYMACIYFYSMINFVASQYLIKTPLLFITLIFSIPIIYLIIQKLEVIGRALFIFWILGTLLFILTFIGLFFQLDFSKLLPIGESGLFNIIKTGFIKLPYTNFILFLFMSIPKDSVIDKDKLNKRSYIFYTLGFLVIIFGCIIFITSLGGELSKIYQYSEFQVLKRVSLVGFVERIESTLSLRWVLYMFITCIMALYFIKSYLKSTFKVKEKTNNILISIIAISSLVISNKVFSNNTIGNKTIINIFPWMLYALYLLLPIVIAVKMKFKKVEA